MAIVKQRWIGPEAFVEVRYSQRSGGDWLDIYCYVRDPRKAQYHKPKYWMRGSSHTPVGSFLAGDWYHWNQSPFYIQAKMVVEQIREGLGLTSSDGRALAS